MAITDRRTGMPIREAQNPGVPQPLPVMPSGNGGLMGQSGGGLMGGLPPMGGVNPSLMQFLGALMSQPGGNPWGAPAQAQLPTFGTPWAGGVPTGPPQMQDLTTAPAPGPGPKAEPDFQKLKADSSPWNIRHPLWNRPGG